MQKLWEKYRELIVYVIVGLMTTVVAYAVRLAILYSFASLLSIDLSSTDATEVARASVLRTVGQTAGWIAGVVFAFFPNKVWVFRDNEHDKGKTFRQFLSFTASRVGTYFVELGLAVLVPMTLNACGYKPFHLLVEVDADLFAMGVSVVLVTVLNYLLSKLLIFKKKIK